MKNENQTKKVKKKKGLPYKVEYLKRKVIDFICVKEFDGWKVLITLNQIEKKNKIYGETDYWAKTININSKLTSLGLLPKIIIHEVLHVLFKNLSEKEVSNYEMLIEKKIDRRETEMILKTTIRKAVLDR